MKKVFCIFVCLTSLVASVFADKSRFYENGEVIDIVYVNSVDGLRVRDYPSLKSNKLCVLSHKMRLQIVAIGKEETIDGITEPWVEILIPNFYWKNKDVPEYGWVFGGYLSKDWPEGGIKFKSLQEKKEYLLQNNYFWSNGPYFLKLNRDGTFIDFVDGAPKSGSGTWTLDQNDNLILIRDNSYGSPEKYHILKYDYGFFEADEFVNYTTYECIFGLRIDWDYLDYPDLRYNKKMYYLYDYAREFLFAASFDRYDLIKCGIPPKENSSSVTVQERYDLYKKYWAPIKKEHQKKANSMK